ncbi:MAG: KamA family radical SAM protein [Kiritimatiellaceae bacterium]|nr:MAG: KamA family radical SAM protein [Kiritimatiellaceae bacterium]
MKKERMEAPNRSEETCWNDWKWQIANRVSDFHQLREVTKLHAHEEEAVASAGSFALGITPYYAQHVHHQGLRKTIVPQAAECRLQRGEWEDPLGEEDHRVAPHLIHTYPDKVLFLATSFCSTYCRYCTRSRMVGKPQARADGYEASFRYIEAHPEIRDVLISGGDPLTMTDQALEALLSRLRSIPHIRLIRIGSKVPAVLPMRITDSLVQLLRTYHVWLSLHFIHAAELTPETAAACQRLSRGGVPMISQTVLLKGVNDTSEALKELFYGLIEMQVKPYYLLQCDPVRGSAHFRTPVHLGVELIRSLHGYISGVAVPQFVIDAPGGGGKVPIVHASQLRREGDEVLFENHEGQLYRYPDPVDQSVGQEVSV